MAHSLNRVALIFFNNKKIKTMKTAGSKLALFFIGLFCLTILILCVLTIDLSYLIEMTIYTECDILYIKGKTLSFESDYSKILEFNSYKELSSNIEKITAMCINGDYEVYFDYFIKTV